MLKTLTKLFPLVLFGAFASVLPIEAQDPTGGTAPWPPELVATLEKLRDAALTSDCAWRQVAHLTENIGPRLSGSRQAQAAVDYVAEELRRLGLDVKLEQIRVPHWVRGEERAQLTVYPGQAAGITQKIVLTALGNSAATPAEGLAAHREPVLPPAATAASFAGKAASSPARP